MSYRCDYSAVLSFWALLRPELVSDAEPDLVGRFGSEYWAKKSSGGGVPSPAVPCPAVL